MKPRVKTGHVPGDLPKGTKIAMLEGRHPDKNQSKTFKEVVRMKERAVLKRRSRKEIERDL